MREPRGVGGTAGSFGSLMGGWEALKRGVAQVGGGAGGVGGFQCVVQGALVDAVGKVGKVVGVGGRGRVVMVTEKAGVVVGRVGGDGVVRVVGVAGCFDGGVVAGCLEREGGAGVLGVVGEGAEPAVVVVRRFVCSGDGNGDRDGDDDGGARNPEEVRQRESPCNAELRIVCPGAVQDVVFLHGGRFVGVVHYDDASGRTLLTLVALDGLAARDTDGDATVTLCVKSDGSDASAVRRR